jgi:hypothetical protein
MSIVREVFEFLLAEMARIQRALGSGFDEVEACLRDGPREEQRFLGLVSIRRDIVGPDPTCDLSLDIRVHQAQIL